MIGSILGELTKFVNKHDDDATDRYNHRYTVMILAVFVFLIASKQYFGEPIVCKSLIFEIKNKLITFKNRFAGHLLSLLVRIIHTQMLFVSNLKNSFFFV